MSSCSGPEPNLKSKEPYERYLGVRELALNPDAANVPQIVKCLDDPHYLVVTGALECLADLARPEFIQHVLPKLKAEHPMVREQACATLAAIRNDEAIPSLIAALKDSDIGVRRAAVKALAAFGKRPEVLKVLVETVGDKDPSVALMAHVMLQNLSGRKDVVRTTAAWTEALHP
jgi:HEAT repeat protein